MKKTVFIVGAGASVDFGLPLGSELAERIRDGLDEEFASGASEGPIRQGFMRAPGGLSGTHFIAAQELRGGLLLAPSIDFFLASHADRPEVVQMGKMAIAFHILAAERNSGLAQASDRNFDNTQGALKLLNRSWPAALLGYLIGSRRPDQCDSMFDAASFVVFNYDRCLEQYLYYGIRHVLHMTPQQSELLLAAVAIFHPYGSLGRIPMGEKIGLPFGGEGPLFGIASNIRTLNEEAGNAREIEAMRAKVADADQLVFLGFGFNEQNLAVMFPEKPLKTKIFATVKLDPLSLRGVESFFSGCSDRTFHNATCPEFLSLYAHDIFN